MEMSRRNMFRVGAAAAAMAAVPRARAAETPAGGVSFASVKESLRFHGGGRLAPLHRRRAGRAVQAVFGAHGEAVPFGAPLPHGASDRLAGRVRVRARRGEEDEGGLPRARGRHREFSKRGWGGVREAAARRVGPRLDVHLRQPRLALRGLARYGDGASCGVDEEASGTALPGRRPDSSTTRSTRYCPSSWRSGGRRRRRASRWRS